MIDIFIVAISSFANLILGAVVFLRNPRAYDGRAFFALTVGLTVWILTNYLTDHATGAELRHFFAELAFLAGFYVMLATTAFAYYFASQRRPKAYQVVLYGGLTVITTFFTLNDFVVSAVKIRHDGTDVLPGELYNLYLIILLGLLVSTGYNFWKTYVKSKDARVRTQIRLMWYAFAFCFLFGILTNAIIPAITGNWELAKIGPLLTVALVGSFSYIIIKHRLLDISYVVLRLLAYTISLSLITILFVFLAFTFTSMVFGGQLISINLQIYYVLTAIVIALLFGPIKKFVDKGTNRLFFQQSYSVHDALSEIGNYATKSVDSRSIQRHALSVIEKTVRPEHAYFIMYNLNDSLRPAVHIGNVPVKTLSSKDFLDRIAIVKHKIAQADDIGKNQAHLKEVFVEGNIVLLVRLSTTNKSIGYLALGSKKNGNNYSRHDLELLTLLSNDLALALQNALAFEEIQEFNETLQSKVNQATAALKRTNQKLVALDDTKDEFISMASHQLRTPLTSIKGYISMMLEGDLGKINDTQRKALEEAFNSSQRMVFLISDFLNISRIRTGKFVMEKSDTDLNKIVLEEIAQLRDLAGLRDQTINYKPPKNFPIVQLDETKTRQVMMNFIDNAIFYTPKNGKIDIVLEQTDKEIVFSVTDTGIGVPKNVQHRLFTKFFRAENARNARPDGTGLGLFMGQKIIDTQGGKIIFNSVEHQGSTFGFRFPLKIVSASGAKSKQ